MRKFTQDLIECHDPLAVGGKGANLGRLMRAGFPVPAGFVVTTQAFRLARQESAAGGHPPRLLGIVRDEILEAYEVLGRGTVAVRSSATAEDLESASMAGQCATFLAVDGEHDLLDAVELCWASLEAPRLRAYAAERKIDAAKIAMAVVVQRLVEADVAGALFTLSPSGATRGTMRIEANWGLGESVVSGQVQPDVIEVEQATGRVVSAAIGDKCVFVSPASGKELLIDESSRQKACLGSRDVFRLWQLGRRVAAHFAAPQDLEWAIHDGNLSLLQSRPITAQLELQAVEGVLRAGRERLRQQHSVGRGPWALHNLAETLPHQTPLTWSVIVRFMSGAGGYGEMCRQAGFEPSPVAEREGFLELIAGQVYLDAARAPEMFGENFPFAYDLEKLAREPDSGQQLPTLPRGSWRERLEAGRRLARVNVRLRELSAGVAPEFRNETAPAIARYVAQARKADLTARSNEELVLLWEERERQVMNVFGAATLKPSLICAVAWADLETFLKEIFWDEDAAALLRAISAGGPDDNTVMADEQLHQTGCGKRPLEEWLAEHGHRGPGEFDLAAPRWREQPEALRKMASTLAAGDPPLARRLLCREAANLRAERLRLRLSNAEAAEFDRRLNCLQACLPLREDGKDLLMLGYELLRDLALEAGARLGIGDGVFYLTREELCDALRVGFAPCQIIQERQLAYKAESSLTLPRFIDQDKIERLGEKPPAALARGCQKALAISAGKAAGPALILQSVAEAPEACAGYVLICPSTDPSWTPLFVNAVALVLEKGGALSHGAVVAREMGLPAVALADATRLFQTGDEIIVNADEGWVGAPGTESTETVQPPAPDPDDDRLPPDLTPPPPGRKERKTAVLRNVAGLFWTIYLLGFFFLPETWLRRPTFALLDGLLWPLVQGLGKPGAVAVFAASLALVGIVLQRAATDNRRLLEAGRRISLLAMRAKGLPEGSPRRQAFEQARAAVHGRVFAAAMTPVCLLLGVMVTSFVWFSNRVDPAIPRGAAGSSAQIVAIVDGDCSKPLRLEVPAPLALDETTPAARTVPPVRRTLERLLALYRHSPAPTNLPWELQVAPNLEWQQTAEDLQRYLDAGIPPRGITWMVRAPEGTVGRFQVKVSVEGAAPVAATVVLGDEFPPGPLTTEGGPGAPIRELRVAYPPHAQKPVFWQPLAGLSPDVSISLLKDLRTTDIGWVWLYLIAYLPVFFLAKFALKVA